MSQRFIMPGGYYPREPVDLESEILNTTVQLLLSKGSFIIENAIWHVVDYTAEFNKFVPRYRVKLRADRQHTTPGTLYNPYEKPAEVTVDIEAVAQAECGECSAAVFFVNARGGFFNREIIMRDAKCCLSADVPGYKKQGSGFNDDEIKKIFDALYKKTNVPMKQNLFGDIDFKPKTSPVNNPISQPMLDDIKALNKLLGK